MKEQEFALESGVSYSAGVAYIIKKGNDEPKLFLILQKPGEKNKQRMGGIFVEQRVWKMPMGHFDEGVDQTIIDAASREFEEETGFVINKKLLVMENSVSIRISSERPGAEFHEDVFFLVITDEEPKEKSKNARDERTETASFFPLIKLPTGVDKESHGVAAAQGHRKKLVRLLLRCASFAGQSGIDVNATIKAIASARN